MHRAGEFADSSAVALRLADGQWSCWIGAIEAGLSPMTGCAELLRDHPASGEATLLDHALRDAAVPPALEAPRAETQHRHAVNLTRAIRQALNPTTP